MPLTPAECEQLAQEIADMEAVLTDIDSQITDQQAVLSDLNQQRANLSGQISAKRAQYDEECLMPPHSPPPPPP